MLDASRICFYCMGDLPSSNGVCRLCGRDNSVRQNGNDELPYALLAKKYIVGHSLGRGGFGVTYIGKNIRIGKQVAIKEYFPADISHRAPGQMNIVPIKPEDEKQFEEGKSKALDEARTIALTNGDPNVVRIYDCFSRNNTVYIIMEYIEGKNLANLIERDGRMHWNQAWEYMKPIAASLEALHRQNLVHRDISPDNIMIRQLDEKAVLLDFGAAIARQSGDTAHSKLFKDGYAAPEQYQDRSVIDGRTDEYAWSATLYYLLTGVRPPKPSQRKFDEKAMKTPRQLRSDIPKKMEEIMIKAMSLNADDRYASMGDMLIAFDSVDQGGKSGRRTSPGGGRKLLIALLALMMGLGIAAIACGLA